MGSDEADVSLEELKTVLAREPRAVTALEGAAVIGGTSRDGGPACAIVPLLGAGWTLESRAG